MKITFDSDIVRPSCLQAIMDDMNDAEYTFGTDGYYEAVDLYYAVNTAYIKATGKFYEEFSPTLK